MLHELAHLIYFNHSDKFILLLKYLFARSTQTGIFDPTELPQIHSKYLWERALYETGGYLSRKYLLLLKEELKNSWFKIKLWIISSEPDKPSLSRISHSAADTLE